MGTLCRNSTSGTQPSGCSTQLSGVAHLLEAGVSTTEAFGSEGYNCEKPCRER